MADMAFWPHKKLGELSFQVLHAFQNSDQGLVPYWHSHEDLTAHLTASGAGLEWLPSSVNPIDAKQNPEKCDHLVQRVAVGDLAVFGLLLHRSSHQISKEGQLALTAGGHMVSELEY